MPVTDKINKNRDIMENSNKQTKEDSSIRNQNHSLNNKPKREIPIVPKEDLWQIYEGKRTNV